MHVNKRLAFLLDHLLSDILLYTYQMSAKSHTLFSVATCYPDLLVSRLIRLGVDLNRVVCNCNGTTANCRCKPALHTAIFYSNVTMVHSLLRYGARINMPYNTSGDNAVHLAIETTDMGSCHFKIPRKNDMAILRMLLGGSRLQTMNDPASLNSIGLSWLNRAVRSSWPRSKATIVELFLSSGLCVDVADQQENLTPLHVAVLNNRVDLAMLLLKHGADHRTTDSRGRTPFKSACRRPNWAIIDLLFRVDATLIEMTVNEWGETAEVCLEREIEELRLKKEKDSSEDESEYFWREMGSRQEMLTKLSRARGNSSINYNDL